MSEAISLEDFASQLAQADAPEQPQAEDSGQQEQVVEAEQETTDPVDAAPEEGAEEAAPEDPETESERVIKWKTAAGEEFEATEDELKSGYLRQADYTRKAQEVAKERESTRAELAKQAEVVQSLAGELGELRAYQRELAQYEGLDWNALATADPAAASQAMVQFQLLKDKANAAYANVMTKKQTLEQEQQRTFHGRVKAAEEALASNVKGITRDEVVSAFGTLAKLGADQATIDAVRSNPALAQMLIHAHRWNELQSKKPAVQNKVKALPPAVQPTKARQAAPQTKAEQTAKLISGKKSFSKGEFAALLAQSMR